MTQETLNGIIWLVKDRWPILYPVAAEFRKRALALLKKLEVEMNYKDEVMLDVHMSAQICADGRRPGDVSEFKITSRGQQVTINGMPLDPRNDLINHSPDGLSWGYGGSGPAQLALALIADATGNDVFAKSWYQQFKWLFIANLEQEEEHTFTMGIIIQWLGMICLGSNLEFCS